ncbi:hypothetical protein ACWFRB_15790 [Rhodococcus sp. NPDC055112]
MGRSARPGNRSALPRVGLRLEDGGIGFGGAAHSERRDADGKGLQKFPASKLGRDERGGAAFRVFGLE